MKFCMHGGTAGTLKSYAEKWFALWVAGDLTFLHTFACCCPFCLSACSTKGAPWAPAFRTMSESKALTKKRPSIQRFNGWSFWKCLQMHWPSPVPWNLYTGDTPPFWTQREGGCHFYVPEPCIYNPRAMLVTEIGGARPPNEIVLDYLFYFIFISCILAW